MKSEILRLRKLLDENKTTGEELFKQAIAKNDKEINAFVTILDKYMHRGGKTLIDNIPYALKDNISTRGILTTA